MLIISLGVLAYAEDEPVNTTNTINNNTEDPLLLTPEGAILRVEQLKARIDAQIAGAEAVIEKLKADGKDTTSLEEIVDQFRELENELDQSSDLPPEDLAVVFIEVRDTARNLTREFRSEAHALITPEEVSQLKVEVRERVRERYLQHQRNLEELKRRVITEKALRLMHQLNIDNKTVIEKLERGEINISQVRNMIAERLRNMDQDQRIMIMNRIKEERKIIRERYKEILKRKEIINKNLREKLMQRIKEHQINSSNGSEERYRYREGATEVNTKEVTTQEWTEKINENETNR